MPYALFPSLVIFFTVYSQFVLRMRLQSVDLSFKNLNSKLILTLCTDFWIFSSIVSLFMSFVFWSVVLSSNINVTKTYPIVTGLTIFFVSLLNVLFFNDKIGLSNVFGACMLLTGIYLILK